MQLSKMDGRWLVVLSLLIAIGSPMGVQAEEALPPPPEAELPGMGADAASAGAELPLMPLATDSAPAEATASAPADALTDSTTSAPEDLPPPEQLSSESAEQLAAPAEMPAELPAELPPDPMLSDVQPEMVHAPEPARLSTRAEFADLSTEEKLKAKDLVLWLSLGPSVGSIATKGNYVAPSDTNAGGLGYAANFGMMLTSAFQMQFDFTGTPLTENSTVTNVMFGFGPRLGFLSVMGLFGVQQGNKLSVAENPPLVGLFAYGVKGSLDLVLSHMDRSRVSYGIAPEVFYVTTQGSNGYINKGVSVAFRIYGYENAF